MPNDMKRVTVNLDSKKADQIEVIAKQNKRSLSAEIAVAIDERIERQPKVIKSASR